MASKESTLDKVTRIMRKPEFIRNICTSAHIHHGKCISGGSRLILSDGSIKTAREIFEEISKDGKVFKENEEYTVLSPNQKIEIFSLNKEIGKIERREIQHAWRLIGGKTIKIKLRNGFEIETTPEHRYIVSRNGFEEIQANDLRLGDRIVCARKLETNFNMNLKNEILERLSNVNFYVNLKEEFQKLLKGKIIKHGIKKLGEDKIISAKAKSFYHGIWQNRYNLSDLIKVCKLFGYNLDEVYDNIKFIFYRTGKQRGHNSLKIRLPQNFDEFYYLAGLFLGDGSGNKFIVGKEELGNGLVEICRNLGFEAKKTRWKDKTPEIHTNMTLAYILKSLFDYPLKQKAHNIKISDFVFKSENKYVAQLLKGYFDTDGSVETGRSAVTIYSASKKMIEDLHLLLLKFGCVAIKEKDDSLSISGLSAINFEKNIGFGLQEKAERLNILVSKVSGSIVCDTIKVGNQVMLINKKLKDATESELSYIEVKSIESSFQEIVYDFTIPENHNFIAGGMVIHNTAFTDNLLAAAGMMASKNAGELDGGMATWQHADEQERLLTVDAANVSMVHDFHGEEYLINLIDTPGHVDFSGNVTRAMRAIDGTIVLVCAVEGIMPQTETVIKQALRERVKPALFINKVDRAIRELKLTPEALQERIQKIIIDFNRLIEQIAEPEYRKKWQVDIKGGSVAFGSARDNWALSIPFMQKKKVGFKDILKMYDIPEEQRKEWAWKNAPLYEVILDLVVKHFPNPKEAQKYRIPKIWHGDLESEFGKSILNCDPNGEPAYVITRIVIDPRSGKEISAGRLFSGTLKPGMAVHLNSAKLTQTIQQVLIYNGVKPEQIPEIAAGNVLAISGVTGTAGETITINKQHPFEELKHIFEPVITKAIEATKPADLPKLVEVLRKVSKEDPSIHIEINEETGENLMSGMGELHLEIIENRIKTEKGLAIRTSPPVVVYRETITKPSKEHDGKSPNKHNIFTFKAEPLDDGIYEAIKAGEIGEGRKKKKEEILWKTLNSLGVSNVEARQYRHVYKGNVFLDTTKGEVYMGEVIDLIMDAFEQVINAGPLAREPCMKLKVSLMDTRLHEDAIHRGPAQVYPAVRDALRECINEAPAIYEPVQIYVIDIPVEFIGDVTKLITSKRGQLLDVKQEGAIALIKAKLAVAEMIGWSSDLRSATEGRGVTSLLDQKFEKLPYELQLDVVRKIRSRKGLAEGQ